MNHISADIIIIGGGAAGLMAAAGAARTLSSRKDDARIIVLEKMPRPGRKIMITGKGRCNFTNLKNWNEFSEHVHPKPGFLKPSFYNLTSEKMIDFLEKQGVECVVERGDRAFPVSHLVCLLPIDERLVENVFNQLFVYFFDETFFHIAE